MTETRPATLGSLLEFVKESRRFDFTGYKRATIERRVAQRMAEVGVTDGYDEYLDYLEMHSSEFAELFNTILVNATGFFRDPDAWERLERDILPQLLAGRAEDAPLRVWCAGCSSGEEAYTIAMVLVRALGELPFQQRVKIYATDVDEEALDQARQGAYGPRQIDGVPPDALERFFEETRQRFVFRRDLRRCVVFGRNDLVADAPISRTDMLVCRNTLMYFNAEAQAQILRRFHFALDDDGVLFVGRSELLGGHSTLFTPVDRESRIFRKVIRPALRERPRLELEPTNGVAPPAAGGLREAAFGVTGSGYVVLDADGVLVMANNAARRMFGIGQRELGRPIQDVDLFLAPVELRGHLEMAAAERRPVEVHSIHWSHNGQERILNLRLTPLMSDQTLIGTGLSYVDVTSPHTARQQLRQTTRELEQAQEALRTTIEELETTNEELETTNEELETTNEELQSTNEELETMNEELQASNGEIEMSNERLRQRTLEVHDSNQFFEGALSALGLAVVVLDRQQRIHVWNEYARELWGLTADETIGQHMLALDIGLPVERLKAPLRVCLSGESTRDVMILESTNRRGRQFECRVTCMAVGGDGERAVTSVIVVMEPLTRGAA